MEPIIFRYPLTMCASGGSHEAPILIFNRHTSWLFSSVCMILYVILTSCNAKWQFCKVCTGLYVSFTSCTAGSR